MLGVTDETQNEAPWIKFRGRGDSPDRIWEICIESSTRQISNVVKFGRDWAISKNVVGPVEQRITTDEYIDYRKMTNDEGRKGEDG